MLSTVKSPIVLLIGLISIMLAGCSPSEQDQQALAAIHLKQANAYHSSGQFRAAMIEAKNVMQKSPNDVIGYVISAKILNTLGQHKQAIDLLEPLPQSMAVSAEFEQALAQAYIGKRKFHTALAALDSAEQLKQHNAEQYNLLRAESLRETGKLDAASALYQSVLNDNPTSAEAHIGVALIGVYQNNIEHALASLEAAQEGNPDNIKAGLILAQIQYKQKRYAEAEALLTDTLLKLPNTDSITPERVATLNLLSDVLVQQGRTAEAMIYTQKLADAFPGYDLALESYNKAEQLAKEGKLELATDSLEQILADNPGFDRAATLLAVIKYMQGDFASASAFLDRNFDAETAHPDLTKIAALSHLKSQKAENVVALLDGYPGLNDDSNLLSIYGAALLATNQPKEAVDALNRAIEINPNISFAYLSLASYYNQINQADKALQHLLSADSVDPANPLVVIALAKQYINNGERAKAEQHIQKNIEQSKRSSASLELAGDFYIHLREHSKALTYYQQAHTADQNQFTSAIKIAHTLELNHSPFDQVIEAYQRASHIEPENPLVYEYMLRYTDNPQQFSKGIEAVAKTVDLNRSSMGNAVLTLYLTRKGNIIEAQHYRDKIDTKEITAAVLKRVDEALFTASAAHALSSNNISEARKLAHSGLKIAPKSIRLMKIIVDIELSQNNFREAKKIISQIGNINPALGAQLSGDMHHQQEQLPEALAAYQTAWQHQPDDQLGAKIYYLTADENEARQIFFSEWKQSFPQSIYVAEIESRYFLAAQDYKNAIPIMESIQQLQPNNTENLNNLAWSYLQTGNNQALATAKQAYENAPNNASIIDTYAWILFKTNNALEKAAQLIDKAATLAPDNKDILEHQKIIKADR